MRKISLFTLLLTLFAVNSHALTLSGSAAINLTNFTDGNSAYLIVDTSGGDTLTSADFTAGLTLSTGTTFGTNFYVAGEGTIVSAFSSQDLTFSLSLPLGTGGVAAADKYYIVGFNDYSSGSVTLAGGDTFGLGSAEDFTLPSNDAGVFTFGSEQSQLNGLDGNQFSVVAVPEPSTYATLAGLFALSWVMVRRRV